MKFCIVGMGTRGNIFAKTLMQSAYAKLVAVADLDPKRVEETAKAYNAKGYTDYRDMMETERPDAVVITTPDATHREPVVFAAEHKINILCEKPYATNKADADAMTKAIKENGVKCLVAFENRWNMPTYAAKTQIDAGDLGKILYYNAKLATSIIVPTQFLPWSASSSPGWYMYPHILDLATWYTGQRVASVYAVGTRGVLKARGIDTLDTIHSIFKLENGSTVQLLSSFILPEKMPLRYDFKIDVVGEKGGLFLDMHDQMVHEVTDRYAHLSLTLAYPLYGKMVGAPSQMLHYFIDCIRNDVAIESNEDAGRDNTIAIEAAHRSVAEERPLDIRYEY